MKAHKTYPEGTPFTGKIGRTAATSEPAWPQAACATAISIPPRSAHPPARACLLTGRNHHSNIVPPGTKLAPRPDQVKAWDSLSADAKKLYARQSAAATRSASLRRRCDSVPVPPRSTLRRVTSSRAMPN